MSCLVHNHDPISQCLRFSVLVTLTLVPCSLFTRCLKKISQGSYSELSISLNRSKTKKNCIFKTQLRVLIQFPTSEWVITKEKRRFRKKGISSQTKLSFFHLQGKRIDDTDIKGRERETRYRKREWLARRDREFWEKEEGQIMRIEIENRTWTDYSSIKILRDEKFLRGRKHS